MVNTILQAPNLMETITSTSMMMRMMRILRTIIILSTIQRIQVPEARTNRTPKKVMTRKAITTTAIILPETATTLQIPVMITITPAMEAEVPAPAMMAAVREQAPEIPEEIPEAPVPAMAVKTPEKAARS